MVTLAFSSVIGLAILVWNGWWIGHSLLTGSVQTLARHQAYLIAYQTEPGWFALNLACRIAIEVILLFNAFTEARQLLFGWQSGKD